MIYETNSAQETFELGRRIGQQAKKGQIYTLEGDLGVGKTVLTQGVAAGLKITEPISSPTFTILQEYQEGRLPFYHLMSIELVTWKKWRRSDMTIIFLETVSV